MDLLVQAGVLVFHAISFLYLFAESNFSYHHKQPHTVSTILLFILNSRACIEVNNSFAGLLIATVVGSFTLHSLDTFVLFLWNSGGLLTILGEYVQKHWPAGEFPF